MHHEPPESFQRWIDISKGRRPSVSGLDVACHEGWFSLQIAQRSTRLV
jgi:hypothetical protein